MRSFGASSVLGSFRVCRNFVIGRPQNCLVVDGSDQIYPLCTPLLLPSLSISFMLFLFSSTHVSHYVRATSCLVTIYFFSYYSGPPATPCSKSFFLPKPQNITLPSQYLLPSILLPYNFGLFSDFYLYTHCFPNLLVSFPRTKIVGYTSELHTNLTPCLVHSRNTI